MGITVKKLLEDNLKPSSSSDRNMKPTNSAEKYMKKNAVKSDIRKRLGTHKKPNLPESIDENMKVSHPTDPTKTVGDLLKHYKATLKPKKIKESLDENIELAKHASAVANASSDAIPSDDDNIEPDTMKELHNRAASDHMAAAHAHAQHTSSLLQRHLDISSNPAATSDHIENSRDDIDSSLRNSENHGMDAAHHIKMASHY